MTCKFHKAIGSLTKDRPDAALVYISTLLPVLIGGGLLVETGRLLDLQTSLLERADAVALTGAAELNRRPAVGDASSSVDRATNASNRFGTSGRTKFTMSNVRFLAGLPASKPL